MEPPRISQQILFFPGRWETQARGRKYNTKPNSATAKALELGINVSDACKNISGLSSLLNSQCKHINEYTDESTARMLVDYRKEYTNAKEILDKSKKIFPQSQRVGYLEGILKDFVEGHYNLAWQHAIKTKGEDINHWSIYID